MAPSPNPALHNPPLINYSSLSSDSTSIGFSPEPPLRRAGNSHGFDKANSSIINMAGSNTSTARNGSASGNETGSAPVDRRSVVNVKTKSFSKRVTGALSSILIPPRFPATPSTSTSATTSTSSSSSYHYTTRHGRGRALPAPVEGHPSRPWRSYASRSPSPTPSSPEIRTPSGLGHSVSLSDLRTAASTSVSGRSEDCQWGLVDEFPAPPTATIQNPNQNSMQGSRPAVMNGREAATMPVRGVAANASMTGNGNGDVVTVQDLMMRLRSYHNQHSPDATTAMMTTTTNGPPTAAASIPGVSDTLFPGFGDGMDRDSGISLSHHDEPHPSPVTSTFYTKSPKSTVQFTSLPPSSLPAPTLPTTPSHLSPATRRTKQRRILTLVLSSPSSHTLLPASTLAACCVLSKAMLPVARAALYGVIDFGSGGGELNGERGGGVSEVFKSQRTKNKFLCALIAHPHLAALVNVFSVPYSLNLNSPLSGSGSSDSQHTTSTSTSSSAMTTFSTFLSSSTSSTHTATPTPTPLPSPFSQTYLLTNALQNMTNLHDLTLWHPDTMILSHVNRGSLRALRVLGPIGLKATEELFGWLSPAASNLNHNSISYSISSYSTHYPPSPHTNNANTNQSLTTLSLPNTFCLPPHLPSLHALPNLHTFIGSIDVAVQIVPMRPVRVVEVEVVRSVMDGFKPGEVMRAFAKAGAGTVRGLRHGSREEEDEDEDVGGTIETLSLKLTSAVDARTAERLFQAAGSNLVRLKELHVRWCLDSQELYTQLTTVLPRFASLERLVLTSPTSLSTTDRNPGSGSNSSASASPTTPIPSSSSHPTLDNLASSTPPPQFAYLYAPPSPMFPSSPLSPNSNSNLGVNPPPSPTPSSPNASTQSLRYGTSAMMHSTLSLARSIVRPGSQYSVGSGSNMNLNLNSASALNLSSAGGIANGMTSGVPSPSGSSFSSGSGSGHSNSNVDLNANSNSKFKLRSKSKAKTGSKPSHQHSESRSSIIVIGFGRDPSVPPIPSPNTSSTQTATPVSNKLRTKNRRKVRVGLAPFEEDLVQTWVARCPRLCRVQFVSGAV